MSTNINLLLALDEKSLKRQKKIKVINFIAIIFSIGIGIASLVLFLLIQAVNPSSAKQERDDILKKISQFQDAQTKLFIVNNRVDSIEGIMKKRKDLSQVTSALLAKTPGKILIQDIEANDGTVIMTAQSTSLSAIGELINNLTDMVRKKEIINSLTLNTLLFDEDKNVYQVSVRSNF